MDKNAYLNKQVEKLGKRIKEIRIQLGYRTQFAFSKVYTGSSNRSSIVSRLEKGVNIDFTTAIRLAQAFEIRIISLFDFESQYKLMKYKDSQSTGDRMAIELRDLGKRINQLRKEKRLNQTDANDVGISEAKLSLYENGKEPMEFETLALIAKWLDVEIWELFFKEEKEN